MNNIDKVNYAVLLKILNNFEKEYQNIQMNYLKTDLKNGNPNLVLWLDSVIKEFNQYFPNEMNVIAEIKTHLPFVRKDKKISTFAEFDNEIGSKIVKLISGIRIKISHNLSNNDLFVESRSKYRKVFIVHGRNQTAHEELMKFLNILGIITIPWHVLVRAVDKPNPNILDIVMKGFELAWGAIILFTPDEISYLLKKYIKDDDPDYEYNKSCQSRPNVLFEAGISFGCKPDRTILTQIGYIRPFSDISGKYIIHLDSKEGISHLILELKKIGCLMDEFDESKIENTCKFRIDE